MSKYQYVERDYEIYHFRTGDILTSGSITRPLKDASWESVARDVLIGNLSEFQVDEKTHHLYRIRWTSDPTPKVW